MIHLPALQSLNLSVDGRTAILRLEHGKANEMGREQIDEWERLAAWLETGAVQSVISYSERVSSIGTPIFIAGANVTERAGWAPEEVKAHVRRQRAALVRLRRAPVFHVCVVHGVALGWGTEFLIACDYRIATPSARFGLPETGLGIVPGAGGAAELATLVGPTQALRLGMTGEWIDADEAEAIGLVDEQADDLGHGLARARELADRVALRSPTAVAAYKAAVIGALGLPGDARREAEARAYEHCVHTGEAAIGRANFASITAGGVRPPWGEFQKWEP